MVISILLLSMITGEISAWRTLGCSFPQENSYDLPVRPGHVAFGNSEIRPLEFDSTEEYMEFSSMVELTFAQVMDDSVLNTFDSYINFFKTYKEWREGYDYDFENFSRFYSSYPASYQLESGDAVHPFGILIRILDEIKARDSRAEDSTYIVTVSTDNSDSDEVLLDPSYVFNHTHLAGVIKIRIGYRLGYLVVDSTIGTPRTVMADGNPLSEAYAELHSHSANTIDMVAAYGMLIRAKTRGGRTALRNIYYVAAALCSFIQTIVKPNLLSGDQYIAVHYPSGSIKEEIHYGVDQDSQSPYGLLVFLHVVHGRRDTMTWILRPINDNMRFGNVVNMVLNGLDMNQRTLDNYITDLTESYDDEYFVPYCLNLSQIVQTSTTLPQN